MILVALLVVGLGAVGYGFIKNRRRMRPDLLEKRLAEYIDAPVSLEKLELDQPFSERVLKPIFNRFAGAGNAMTPAKTVERLRRNLSIAGNPNGLQPADFMGLRMVAMLVLGGIVLFLAFLAKMSFVMVIMAGVVFALIGYMLPIYWLDGKMKARRKLIQRALPDAIDLLTISVEAGLGFDQALQRVTEKWETELGKEFKRVLSESRVGKPKREALREMSNRCDVQDLNIFVASIIQAEQLGVSIGKVLSIQSDQMRVRRRQLAEEMAHKAPIKMIFPMVFLIFPSVYIVILGPAVPTIAPALGF
ncbi:MAG: type II secretion system F family protein [Chloroflexi bacterium]|nr:type II secretion system F family protein [Chloroflexota bacterium]